MIDRFRDQYAFLSNFYFWGSLVHYAHAPYPTVEHAFQAAKTLDLDERLKIQRIAGPVGAKQLGQGVTLRPDWDALKNEIMLGLLQEKFATSPLREMLHATLPHDLVEGNTWGDRYWGVCRGKGENWLGTLLMQVREEIQA